MNPSSPASPTLRVDAQRRGGFAFQQVKASLEGAVFDALSLDIYRYLIATLEEDDHARL